MTTIFIDLKKKKIVADRQGTGSSIFNDKANEVGRYYTDTPKIFTVGEGVYAVGSGNLYEFHRQVSYIINNSTVDLNVQGELTLALVRTKGKGLLVDLWETVETKGLFKTKRTFTHKTYQNKDYLVFGSGSKFAQGAFEAGKSAEDSVRIASMCDEYTGYEIDVVQL